MVNDELSLHLLFSLTAYSVGPSAETINHHSLVVNVARATKGGALCLVLAIIFTFDFSLQL